MSKLVRARVDGRAETAAHSYAGRYISIGIAS
jgi:hypothetical protein